MHRSFEDRDHQLVFVTASEGTCSVCGRNVQVSQHRSRWVDRLDGLVHLVRRDKRCPDLGCGGHSQIFRPPEDARFVLPRMNFGTDVVIAVGERHLDRHESFERIRLDLACRGVPIHQTHVGELYRYFLALCQLARGDDAKVRARLRARGGIVLMIDGVQFDEHSPVIYLIWDALSGEPLFAERRAFRGADDLRSLLLRVKAMDVPIIGVVSDKETGLVPAVLEVFPDAPYQFCQTHFLKNCGKPLAADLSALNKSVADRAENVREIAKRLHVVDLAEAALAEGATVEVPAQSMTSPEAVAEGPPSEPTQTANVQTRSDSLRVEPEPAKTLVGPASTADKPASPVPISERDFVAELCVIARENSRASGKAPLGPPELARHNRLEAVRQAVDLARETARKKGRARHH